MQVSNVSWSELIRVFQLQGGQKWAAQQQGAGTLGSAEVPEEARAPPANPLAAVQRCLALTAPPKKMLGREAEHQRIATFVEEALVPGMCSKHSQVG